MHVNREEDSIEDEGKRREDFMLTLRRIENKDSIDRRWSRKEKWRIEVESRIPCQARKRRQFQRDISDADKGSTAKLKNVKHQQKREEPPTPLGRTECIRFLLRTESEMKVTLFDLFVFRLQKQKRTSWYLSHDWMSLCHSTTSLDLFHARMQSLLSSCSLDVLTEFWSRSFH